MFENLGMMYNVQRTLSGAQATPIVGPLFVSPVKAVVSIAQIIGGLVFGILFAPLSFVFNSEWLAGKSLACGGHLGLGFFSLGYSLTNIVSLGFVGYKFEVLKH